MKRGAKSAGRKGGKGRGRRPRRSQTVAERASLSENKPLALLQTNQMYQSYNIQLADFPRAVAVAKAYQLYRIKSVRFILSPLADTFTAGGGTTVPYLYWMIDRTKNLVAANAAVALKRMGAKPIRIDDKKVTWSYKPSVLNAVYDSNPPVGQATSAFVEFKVSPWLNTRDSETIGVWNADTTDHQGCKFIVENAGGNNISYKLEYVVEFEFCKPSFEVLPTEGIPEPVDLVDVEELVPPAPDAPPTGEIIKA